MNWKQWIARKLGYGGRELTDPINRLPVKVVTPLEWIQNTKSSNFIPTSMYSRNVAVIHGELGTDGKYRYINSKLTHNENTVE